MKNILKHIIISVLAGFFIISYTGVNLLLHHCLACDTKDYYLFSDISDCCDHHEKNHHNENNNHNTSKKTDNDCCKSDQKHCENCCEEELVYVKNEFDASKERQEIKIKPIVCDVIIYLTTDNSNFVFDESNFSLLNLPKPPPKLVAKDFVIFSHSLKIG